MINKTAEDVFKGYSNYERNDRIRKVKEVVNYYYGLRKNNIRCKLALLQTTAKFHITFKTIYNYIAIYPLIK